MRREDGERHERRVPSVALSEPITVLGLGVRASNCLLRARIATVGDLVGRRTDDLRQIRNLGEGTLREIVDTLGELRLRLGSPENSQNGLAPTPVRTVPRLADGDILRSRVGILELGIRAANCLRVIEVITVEELVRYRPEDLLRTRNLGATSLRQIVSALAKHALWLGMDEHAILIRMARTSGTPPGHTKEDIFGRTILSSGVQVLKLGVRASNCLQTLGVHTVEELLEWSAADLARIRNLGSRTLQQIIDTLTEHGLSLRDPPIEVFRRTLREGLRTAEAELDYIVTEVISARKGAVVTLRLGWSGQRIRTLKELGENPELSLLGNRVTRERIRQIESNAKGAIRAKLDGVCPRRISEALRIVTDSTPIAADHLPDLLRKHGVSKIGLHYSALRNAVEVAGIAWDIVPLTTGANPVLISNSEQKRYTSVLRVLSSTRNQTFSVVSDTAKLAALPSGIEGLLNRLINAHSDFQWLDRDAGVYWYTPGGEPRPSNKILFQCRKLFSLCSRPHLDEIYRAVQRTRTVAKLPARHVLLEMLGQTTWCRVDGNYAQLREGIRFDELNSNDRRLVRAAAGLGSPVTFLELRDSIVRGGLTSIHASQIILFSPFLYRVSRGRYRLLFDGDDLSARQLRATESSPRAEDAGPRHGIAIGATSQGDSLSVDAIVPTAVVQVSSRVLITDRIFVNLALPSSRWDVVDAGGRRIGHCKTSPGAIYELATVLQCLGAKAGHTCHLKFDKDLNQVEIRRLAG